ncbi:TlyA family RNA methyltransferase [Clostridium sp. D2Q-11]|uniref:TlyA family RNA methyltransferase n=1 Tax=Anaeromonas frigoriresistens TaxID=2683708 RepID=A0A942ZA88_9FIRM|nr:TlyA family RNA methyltransferase [Anaeromonas frigoriresistens]MBS4539979.1 TlyA family RNA methyltransferase [Anaeromonas frigoriresistens]
MEYIRIDILMNDKGIVESRELAQKAIKKGLVKYNDKIVKKSSLKVPQDANVELIEPPLSYVGRGGYKLEKAIKVFNIDLTDKIAMDIGASTGGFTDCMLQNDIKKVFAVDVGYNQLAEKLIKNNKVINMEKTNIRNLEVEDIGEKVDFISIDVSFISLTKVLPIAKKLIKTQGEIVALIKPQFEAGKDNIGKKGVVKNPNIHLEVIDNINSFITSLGYFLTNIDYSPIKGGTGNIEYIAYITQEISNINIDNKIQEVVRDSHNKL